MTNFQTRYRRAAADPHLRRGLLDFQRSWRVSRDQQIARLEQRTGATFNDLRRDFAQTKDDTLAQIDHYIAEFRTHAEAASATVVEVETAQDALNYVTEICRERGIDLIVKSKSMVSEEIELNHHLEAQGIRAIETDLGEWLLQLARERPSHLVMPAIHQRRERVAALLGDELNRQFDPDDIPAMVASARGGLRDHFLAAGAGLTGANALIAETGSIMLVTNEGNARLATSLPGLHFVTAGIEKLVPTWADAQRQLQLLPRSATAQQLSTYTTCITGAQPGKEMHIILLDNGRRKMAADPQIAAALRCIRCGACANVCPPYQVVGGHAFGHIYTGAIGLVNTPFHHGPEHAADPQSLCVSCGACAEVCPVQIPLPDQILQLRSRSDHAPRWERLALRAWAHPAGFRIGARLAALASPLLRRLPLPPRHRWRAVPNIPWRNARQRIAARPPQPPIATTEATGRDIALFLQCLTDALLPSAADAAARLLEAAGATVHIPPDQHCCGLPAFDAGDWPTARKMAKQTIETLEAAHDGDIVTPAASCHIAVQRHWPQLFAEDPAWRARAEAVARRTHDLAEYLETTARLPDACLAAGEVEHRPSQSAASLQSPPTPVSDFRQAGASAQPPTAPPSPAAATANPPQPPPSYAVHRFCQGSNLMGWDDRIERLIARLTGAAPRPLEEASTCCGFGGITSITAPEVGAGILDRKLDCVEQSAANTLLTNNPGCVLHLRAGAEARRMPHRTLHYAEYLAARLPIQRDRPL